MAETKRCPYCGEEIMAAAKKCKHCGKWLNQPPTVPEASDGQEAPAAEDEATATAGEAGKSSGWGMAILKAVVRAIVIIVAVKFVFDLIRGDLNFI